MRIQRKPDAYVRALGVTVRIGWVPVGAWGTYDAELHLITLKPGLAPLQMLCTLMHELGHAAHKHHGTSAKQEREADEWAAVRLISKRDFIDAALVEDCAVGMAHRLGVLPEVVLHYVNTLTDGERQSIDALVRGISAA
jgi:hypothetical protein